MRLFRYIILEREPAIPDSNKDIIMVDNGDVRVLKINNDGTISHMEEISFKGITWPKIPMTVLHGPNKVIVYLQDGRIESVRFPVGISYEIVRLPSKLVDDIIKGAGLR